MGGLTALVNNAAIFSTIKMKPFWEMSVAEWDRLMAPGVMALTRPSIRIAHEEIFGPVLCVFRWSEKRRRWGWSTTSNTA
jgi:NAD(P)-dependent dehydrogenase (short-subunit alcohol dehydrogenase family)